MNILILGGTRYFGIHLVHNLILSKNNITIATRGLRKDPFGNSVKRVIVDKNNENELKEIFKNMEYDIVYDNLAYSSEDVRRVFNSIKFKKYIMVSSTSVYDLKINTKEEDFSYDDVSFKWANRDEYTYSEGKQLAEYAVTKLTNEKNAIFVRFPFVIGIDDYTERLFFYVKHVIEGIPMYIDNLDNQMSFINSQEAGKILSDLSKINYAGPLNAASKGTVSLSQIIQYIEKKVGKKAIINLNGDIAPYNQTKEYSISINKAESLGLEFSYLSDYIYHILDAYIKKLIKL